MWKAIACIFTFTLFCTECTTTPETNRRALSFIPASQMNAMGEQLFQELRKSEPPLKNPALVERITNIANRIAAASNADYDWEVQVFDAPKTVNAFSLPGGKIGVYSGIVPIAQTDAGLAAVLGHEVAHATLGHGAERMSQAVTLQLGIQVADLTLSNVKHRNVIIGAFGIGGQVSVLLPFSRLHEREADIVGARYMARAGYDPAEAVEVWKRMAAEAQSLPPELLSTHPDPGRRAELLAAELDELTPVYAASEKQPSRPLPALR